jgi:hypothetical protein
VGGCYLESKSKKGFAWGLVILFGCMTLQLAANASQRHGTSGPGEAIGRGIVDIAVLLGLLFSVRWLRRLSQPKSKSDKP